MEIEQGVRIRPDRIKGHIAEVEQSSHADHDIQAEAQHHVQQGGDHDVDLVGGNNAREDGKKQKQSSQPDSSASWMVEKLPTFLRNCLPLRLNSGKNIARQRAKKSSRSGVKKILPPPDDRVFRRIDLNHQKGKGEEGEPEGREGCFFHMCARNHHVKDRGFLAECSSGQSACRSASRCCAFCKSAQAACFSAGCWSKKWG